MEGRPIAYGAFLFAFMGGSMGSVVGEKIARLFERATEERLPVVLSQASGGARMQEGILSLMQMAKTVSALERLRAAGLPFISVLLHPTTGGVAASFALLGDVNIAEPKAPSSASPGRVSSSRPSARSFPEGFQRSEFLLAHGMVDRIVSRLEMKGEIARADRAPDAFCRPVVPMRRVAASRSHEQVVDILTSPAAAADPALVREAAEAAAVAARPLARSLHPQAVDRRA